jgi:hypothetical protein
MSMVGFISCFEFVRLFVRISAADLAMMRKTLKRRMSTTEYYEAVESRLCGVEGEKMGSGGRIYTWPAASIAQSQD